MIDAIRQIGKWQIKKSGKSNLDVLTKEPKFKESKIVFIVIDPGEKKFKGVELEDYDLLKSDKYMSEIGSSKGNTPTPFAEITEPERTFTKKIKVWFKKCQKSSSGTKENNIIVDINDVLNTAEKEIVTEVQAVFTEIKKKTKQETLFLSLKLNDKYLGD